MVRLSKPQLARVDQLIRQGKKPQYIANEVGSSRRHIENLALRILVFNSIENPQLRARGRRRVFNEQMKEELGWLLVQRSDLYQEELQFYFLDHWNVWISQPTVSRAISSLDLTWKRNQFKAAQQSEDLRLLYLQRLQTLTANHLVFADESSMSGKTLDRKYGYAPKGLPSVVTREKRQSQRYSLLPAYTIKGYLPDPLVVKGAVDGDQFVDWLINCVLPQMNPFPEDQSVLIIDNCSTHRSEVRTVTYLVHA